MTEHEQITNVPNDLRASCVGSPAFDNKIQERSGRTLFGRISNNIPENDVGVCRNITVLLPSCFSFSFKQKIGTYRKTKLEDNCWMKLYMSGNPGAAMLSFVDSDDKNINVPDEFILTDISRGHIQTKIDPISLKLFALVISHNYSFTYKDKSGKLILQWAMMGDFVWE